MKLIVDVDIILQSAMNNLSALHMEDVDPVIKQLDDARGQIQTFMCTANSSPAHSSQCLIIVDGTHRLMALIEQRNEALSQPGATTEHKSE